MMANILHDKIGSAEKAIRAYFKSFKTITFSKAFTSSTLFV